MRKLKKKKSAGTDDLTKEHLTMGANVPSTQLTTIFNASIINGAFQKIGKRLLFLPNGVILRDVTESWWEEKCICICSPPSFHSFSRIGNSQMVI